MAFVRVQHPDIEGTATVSDVAFPFYEAKGWELVEPEPAPETSAEQQGQVQLANGELVTGTIPADAHTEAPVPADPEAPESQPEPEPDQAGPIDEQVTPIGDLPPVNAPSDTPIADSLTTPTPEA